MFHEPRLAENLRFSSRETSALFVVCPQTEDLYDSFFLQYLIHEPMVDVDPSRVSSCEVADQLLVGWRILERVLGENGKQRFGFASEVTGG